MHHMAKRFTARMLLALSLITSGGVKADPAENPSQSLKRTAASGLTLNASLTKNITRQVPYQANYTVQVPYETTETYYEDVPYQDTEAYTDYETRYEDEQVCETVGGGSHQECHTENECHTVGGGQSCHNEQECHQGSSHQE